MASAAAGPATDSKDGGKRSLRRVELRTANLAAWERGGPPEGLGKLDTSLKRHTALLVKFRSSLNTAAAIPGLLKEISQLSLEKYVEEAVGAVVDGLGKCKTAAETAGAVEVRCLRCQERNLLLTRNAVPQVVSAMHQRFPALFTPPFNSLLLQGLKPGSSTATDRDIQEKENNARIIKQRGLLRVVGELEAVGVVRKEGGNGATGEVTWAALKDLLTSDKEALALVAPLAIAFAKHLGSIYLPPADSTTSTTEGEASAHDFPTLTDATQVEDDAIVSRDMKDKFRKLLVAFFDALGKREQKLHLELQRQDKRNHEAYIRSGEVFEDREKNYEKAVKSWERGWASVTQLAEVLSLPLPTLPSLQSTLNASIVTAGSSGAASGEELGPQSLWADEEEKKFYEDLVELRGKVPNALLGVAEEEKVQEVEVKEEAEAEKAEGDEEKDAARIDDEDAAEEPEDPVAKLETAEPDPSIPSGPAAQLNAIFARLPEASSKKSIDDIAVEFAFLNSKAARKRLVKTLGSVSRNRQDILPYYSRLVGTLNPYMPDVGKELVALLEDEFRYLQRKKNADFAETRSKNLRFISELTKFRVTPLHVIFYIYKVLLDDFSGPNIDNFCTVLEGCGRFLLRSEATSERMRQVVDTFKRKKAAMHLDERQTAMLENAYYQCDPPDRPAIPPKERTPMQLYIRHLFYNVLNRNSSDKVLKLLRKLHWEDPAARRFIVRKLHNAFTKVWKIKYSNVHLFAVLLYDLGRYHPEFSVSVIDDVLENIRVGMEINNFKYNQQRVATVKYLGELYNYRVLDSRVIFDTLWSLVSFGHPDGRPHPDLPSAIDTPDDYFRIRLVCTLLDTCGACFDRGALKKKLDNFLVFFQMYALSKGSLPMDVGFMYSDTLEQLRPKLVKYQTFPEAVLAVDEMMAAVAKEAPVEDDVDEQDGQEGARPGADEEDEEGSETEGESETDTIDADGAAGDAFEDDEDTHEGRGRDPNAMTQEEEDDFARELAKMMVSSTEARKAERKPVSLDVGIPLIRKAKTEDEVAMDEAAQDSRERKGMQFTLLTKKGNRQQARPRPSATRLNPLTCFLSQALSMEIPRESSIAISTVAQREQHKAEQERLKRLVLDYESREEEADKQALKETLARRGIVLNYGAGASRRLIWLGRADHRRAENRKKGIKFEVVP
ncbi:Armadillo-type fold [Rhodotorula toruloides]|uniref:Armadillo-type fold n=1 Tax=Rhodotorula toruloides TaxID=5286 RepID=A0A2T0ACR2_RHOTO|nr:Armadillo-type fold [Rhodotorula toruloides]